MAGQRATGSAAFASALTYLASGAALLAEDCWERRHDLAFALELNRAECEYSTGQPGPAEEHLGALAPHAPALVERAAIACLRMDLYLTQDQAHRAVGVGLDFLRDIGVEWSPHPSEEELRREYERIGSQLGPRAIEDLIDLPVLSDPSSLAIFDVLAKLAVPAHATDNNLHGLVNSRAVSLSIERGNCEASCYAYVWLGAIAGAQFGDYQAGYRFARMGYELGERRGWKSLQPATYLVFGSVILPWARHVKDGRDLMRRAIESANSIGDLNFAVGTGPLLNTNMLAGGDHLADVEQVARRHLERALKAGYGLSIEASAAQVAFVRTLRGMTPTFGCLGDEQFEEAAAEQRFAGNPNLQHAECWYWIRKLQARFLAGDYAAAITSSSRAERLLWTAQVVFEAAEYHLYSALSRAACYDTASRDGRQQHLEAMALHQRQLDIWARSCPENFENRAWLVGAEIARIEGRELDAERLYEDAIRSARENEFVHNEALANELAARFYAARGFHTIAHAYLRHARYGYLRWGADGKVRQLETQHPYLTSDHPSPESTRTVKTPVDHLDLSTVLRVSQAVQGETDVEKLIAAIMRLGLEHAGAERGLLLLPHGDAYRIEAEARSGNENEGVTVDLRQSDIGAGDLPQSVFRYALRTRERVLLQDALATSEFADDEYLRRHHARSVLCMPLLKQTRLAGIIYLENNLTSGAFTPARMALLEVLASDAAISLENARLYREISALKDQLYKENLVLRDEVERTSMFEEIVGASPALRPVLARVAKVARTDSTVLITGETGTGKELVARAVHRRSARASHAFVCVNCATVPRELIASELFGHEKGAFTGAVQRRLGRFELAQGGTIFLDEVGELLMETQVALLRVLQEREFERVGGRTSIRVDVRVIAATNRDLQAAIDAGTFRTDLFYRLNVFPIAVPALRERAEDVPLLVEYFIDRYARKAGKTIRRVNRRTLDHLRAYPWPGNVRELQNVIERSVIVCDTDEFTIDESWLSARPAIEGSLALAGTVAAHEKAVIEDALRACGGRVYGPAGAAARLGIPRSTLESKIRAFRINKNHFRL